MKITLNRVNENYHFELKNERGHIVNVDNRSEFGEMRCLEQSMN
jgi:putative redox protein